MADQYTDNGDFWSKAGPGLLDFGFGIYNRGAAESEAANRLKRARGPIYDQSTAAASGMLTAAGNFDPQTFAADRFEKQQALMKPVQDKSLNDLLRTLYAKGQLGAGTYNAGLEGGTPDAGMLMNPKIAAFYAAQNAQRSKDAYGALDQGQSYLDKLLSRAGTAQKTAADAQRLGLEAERTQPSRAASNAQLFKGATGILKDSGAMNEVFKPGGLLGQGADWLKNLFGGGASKFPMMAGPGAGDSSDFPIYMPPTAPSWAGNDWRDYGNGDDWSWT